MKTLEISTSILPWITLCAWAIGDLINVVLARKLSHQVLTLWTGVCSVLSLSLMLPFQGLNLAPLTPALMAISLALGALFILSNNFFNRSMQVGSPSVAGTIVSCFVVVTVLLSTFFFDEHLSLTQVGLIALTMCGIVLASLSPQEHTLEGGSVLHALCAMLGWGVFFAFIKIPVRELGWFTPLYLSALCFPLYLLLCKLQGAKLTPLPDLKSLALIFVVAFLLRSGDLCFNLASTRQYTALVAPIAGAAPVLYVTLCWLLLGDRIAKRQWLGVVLALLGVITLSSEV